MWPKKATRMGGLGYGATFSAPTGLTYWKRGSCELFPAGLLSIILNYRRPTFRPAGLGAAAGQFKWRNLYMRRMLNARYLVLFAVLITAAVAMPAVASAQV